MKQKNIVVLQVQDVNGRKVVMINCIVIFSLWFLYLSVHGRTCCGLWSMVVVMGAGC